MTEETTTENTTEDRKTLGRRWSIVGIGALLAAAIIGKGLSERDEQIQEGIDNGDLDLSEDGYPVVKPTDKEEPTEETE